MKLSYTQLKKLRSGQTVWRVTGYAYVANRNTPMDKNSISLGEANKHDDLRFCMHIERVIFLGKKQHVWLDHIDGSGRFFLGTKMVLPKRLKGQEYGNSFRYARFLTDQHGDGAFTQQRQAERFVADVLAGQYPEMVNREVERYFEDQRWEEMRRDDDWHNFNEYDGAPEGDVDF